MAPQNNNAPQQPLAKGDQGAEVQKLHSYLKKFGYFPNEKLTVFRDWRAAVPFDPPDTKKYDETMEQAVRMFQRAQGLKEDGKLNEETLALMQQPRCGFPDIVPGSGGPGIAPSREVTSRDFVLQGNRWPSPNLTYRFDNFTNDTSQANLRAAIRGSLDRWAAVSPLNFTETGGSADIRIGWFTGDHGDGSAFDGPSGVLAHAFFPPPNGGDIAGDMHFDDSETWSVNLPPTGIDLPTVSLHEFGHSLGLNHSNIPSAVMYAFYGGPRRELTDDDIQGIQAIYGARFRWASLGGAVFDPVAINNQDGRLEVFAKGTDNALWHIWQTAPNNGWSGWASRGGVMGSKVAAGRNQDGRLEVFVRGTDGALWHIWQHAAGGWSGWASRGGVITTAPAVGRNADGRLEVFAKGTDNALWHIWQTAPNNGWSGWASRGGVITSEPVVVSNADGRLEVFVKGTDNALWHIWQTAPNNGWSGWQSLGGTITSLPAVGRNADGRLEVVARSTDNALWHIWQTAPNSGWSGWASLGGIVNEPTLVNNADGRLEVFVRGSDNALWHMWQTSPSNGWSGWSTLGGQLVGGPVAARNQDGRLEVFVKGTDNALWHTWQSAPNGGWS
ncbi:MAG TPA: matrixin family metalloprotease [Pyrinomonadaceae bacterium]|jgi:peptidoglycan hydrolase-like protein with peptidoglycan-binding domain